MTAVTIADLNNGKTDVDHISEVATSTALTATDRKGHTKDTVAGALYKIGGITNRGAWAGPGTNYASKDIAQQGGTWYICTVPHTSTASFAADSPLYWRVYQGVTTGDLSAGSGASIVGTQLSMVGAAVRTLAAVLGDITIFATAFVGANITAQLANAFAVAPAGAVIVLPPGTYSVGSVNVTGKAMRFTGYGANVTCTDPNGVFYKTDHDNKLSVLGFNFVGSGTGRAINHAAAPSTTVYDELLVEDCIFNMAAGVYGIYCVGSREPRINRCTFFNTTSGCGIYFKDCVSPFVLQGIFKGQGYVGRAIYYPGSGNGTDAGFVLRDSEIMGWDKGLELVGCDWFHISGSTIDYNNWSIKIAAQDGGILHGNYLGSVGVNPALWLTYDAGPTTGPNICDKLQVTSNTFTGHYVGAGYDCVLIDGAVSSDNLRFDNNEITFYTRYGINFSMLNTRLLMGKNHFAQRTGYGVSPIYNQLGANDSGVVARDNTFSNGATIAGMNLSSACVEVSGNLGCLLATSGQAGIAVGSSSITFAHGITGYVPTTKDVFLQPLNTNAIDAQPYPSAIDATNITISTKNVVAGFAAQMGYRISRHKY